MVSPQRRPGLAGPGRGAVLYLPWLLLAALLVLAPRAGAERVTGLAALHRHGQTFLTWTCPAGTGWTYRLYAATFPILSTDDLSAATLVGSVGDSTWCDRRLSACTGVLHAFAIDSLGPPLDASRGLFVVTATTAAERWYAVTAQRWPGAEDRSVEPSGNALDQPVTEVPDRPRPVFQRTILANTGTPLDVYTLWTSPVPAPDFPAMGNRWGMAYDCGVVRGGTGDWHALAIRFCRRSGNFTLFPEGTGMRGEWSLSLDDFVSNQDQNTWWFGYHEGYETESSANLPPTAGVVHDFVAQRVAFTIEWARRNFPVDTTRVYAIANSMGGTGALLLPLWRPDLVTASLSHVPRVDFSHELDPIPWCSFNPGQSERLVCDRLWGAIGADLPSNDGRPVYHRLNAGALARDLEGAWVPPLIVFSGRNDALIGWAEKISFYEAMRTHRQGGILFWDQRDHMGIETGYWAPMLDRTCVYRYRSDRSFPAFSNCSADDDPGDGTPATGDTVGVINGFVEWDSTVVDTADRWEVTLTLRDLASRYGTVPAPESLTVDVTPRRVRGFPSIPGGLHRFRVRRLADGALVHEGVLVADTFGLVTAPAVKVYRGAGTLLTVEAHSAAAGVVGPGSPPPGIVPLVTRLDNPAHDELRLDVHWPAAGQGEVALFDVAGRRVLTLARGPVARGPDRLRIGTRALRPGVYLLRAALDGAATVRRVAVVG